MSACTSDFGDASRFTCSVIWRTLLWVWSYQTLLTMGHCYSQ